MKEYKYFSKKILVVLGVFIFLVLFIFLLTQTNTNTGVKDVEDTHEEGGETAILIQEVNGPFTITYLGNDKDSNYFIFSISTSSPRGREKAMDWLRDQGYNPTESIIEFSDYENPTAKELSDVNN